MQIERKQITVRELVEGYLDKGLDGVVAYGGKLDVRPRISANTSTRASSATR